MKFLPEAASSVAPGVDALMAYILFVSACFIALIGSAIFFFAVKYHHTKSVDRSRPVHLSLTLEVLWMGIPLALTLSMFVWGAKLFIVMREPPPDALEIDVVGKQWMWEIQHAEGRRELNEVHVPVGRPVKLLMTSADVIHSFFIPAFRVKQDVLPGRYTTEWFEALTPGRYRLYCTQYCGTAHSAMTGWVTVLSAADFQRWLSRPGAEPTMIEAGERLFRRAGCVSCHREGGSGPELEGVFGRREALEGGGTAIADETYLRESILRPNAKVVEGWPARMPPYEGRLDEAQLQQLVSYLKSMKGA